MTCVVIIYNLLFTGLYTGPGTSGSLSQHDSSQGKKRKEIFYCNAATNFTFGICLKKNVTCMKINFLT